MKNLPKHVAIIMDGNRRWAREHRYPIYAGHKKVVEDRIEELIEEAATLKIPNITFWAFSTENWGRSTLEVKGIISLFRWALRNKAQSLKEKGARVRMIGDLEKFPKDVQEEFAKLVRETKENKRITTVFALNYGGRDEMVRAIKSLAAKITDSILQPKDIDQKYFSMALDTAGIPDPDLIIRTGGEQRLSGFMLWQAEYSELYFTKTLMPDFGAKELDEAVAEYGRRQRRRGK